MLLLEEELVLGLPDALEFAGLDVGAAEDLAAAEIGVEELALALQLALQHVHWLALAAPADCGGGCRDRVGFARARTFGSWKWQLDRRALEVQVPEGSAL